MLNLRTSTRAAVGADTNPHQVTKDSKSINFRQEIIRNDSYFMILTIKKLPNLDRMKNLSV